MTKCRPNTRHHLRLNLILPACTLSFNLDWGNWDPALVLKTCFCLGCINRIPWTAWLTQQTCVGVQKFWKPGIWNQGACIVGFLVKVLFLVYRWPPSYRILTWQWVTALVSLASLNGTNLIPGAPSSWSHLHWMTTVRPHHIQMPSYWALVLQYTNLGQTQTFSK